MPLHSSRIRARIPKLASTARVTNSPTSENTTFASTEEDKRRIKHSSFVSRIEKSTQSSKKRRRPSKKLVANLESLVDALPDLDGPRQNISSVSPNVVMRQKSLKSRPGAMKKKAKLDKVEMDRFNRNMAQLADRPTTAASQVARDAAADSVPSHDSTKRWQALRGFIASTMDREAKR